MNNDVVDKFINDAAKLHAMRLDDILKGSDPGTFTVRTYQPPLTMDDLKEAIAKAEEMLAGKRKVEADALRTIAGAFGFKIICNPMLPPDIMMVSSDFEQLLVKMGEDNEREGE